VIFPSPPPPVGGTDAIQASDLGLSFKCDANTLKEETVHRPDTRHWAKLEFKHAGILSGSAIDETRMTSPVPGLPAASTIVSLSGDKNSVEDDWSFEDRPKSRESGQARCQRRRRSAPPYSLSIKSYISHGRLSDAYHSTLRSYSSLTQTYSSLTDSRRTPKVYPSVTKLIDLNTFPKTTADEYTYSAVEARKAALNEVVMMHRLRSVWGTVVPRLYGSWISVSSTRDLESGPGRGGAGEDGDGKEEQVVVLCMQDAGEMWTDRPETLHPTDK